MTYDEALEYIHGIYWRGSKLGLSRTREILELLGNPQKQLKFVHVAGTNGKGSTCAMLASIFQKAGYKTGLYISPYIIKFNERMQFNGEPISDEELAEITEYVSNYAESMKDKPTEFELVTAIGMEFFKRKCCDIVILETGLGGELDSTNVIDSPEAAIITAIDIDHIKELGGTIEGVASAKAGIIKNNCDVVFYGNNAVASDIFVKKCHDVGANYHETVFDSLIVKECNINGTIFDYTIANTTYKNIHIPLPGTYQVYNCALVLTAIELLKKKYKLDVKSVSDGISNVKWPGRFEVLHKEPFFIADGGHNPHGIQGTADSIRHHFQNRKIIAIMGVMADKDVSPMLDILSPLVKIAYTVKPNNPRAMDPELLAKHFEKRGIKAKAYNEIKDGVYAALNEAKKDDIICALGSFYMYSDIANALKKYFE